MEATPTQAGRASRRHTRRLVRLRRWLLGGVVLLGAVLAGLFWYARYRAHRFLVDVPRRLGIDIQSETNGFTLSQSSKGRTLFTVHAAKAIQRGNGKTTLHDVAITVYGPKGSNRTDSMRGDDFEYDQANGVVRTAGEVRLDLAAPAASGNLPKPGAQRIQVTAHGMVFLQKLGVAATDEPLEIVYGGLHGGAAGADYESDTGVLRLRRDVHLDGTDDGHTIHLTAARAELERLSQLATLEGATVGVDGSRMTGDHMKIAVAKGQVQRAEAQGHVVVDGERGVHMEANRVHGAFSAAGKPELLVGEGGVRLRDASDSATAAMVAVRLDAAGLPVQADLRGAVQVAMPRADGAPATLKAGHVVAQLAQNGNHTELRDTVASEGAELRAVEPLAVKPVTQAEGASHLATVRTTVVTAATLHATSGLVDGVRYVNSLHGEGSTRVEQSDDAGNRSVSTADTLQADLRAPAKDESSSSPSSLLRSAVQTGHVTIAQHRVGNTAVISGKGASAGQVFDTHATAQKAEYRAESDEMVLSGAPVVSSPEMQVQADVMTLNRATGSADADGTVKGVLMQKGSASGDPIHVLAEHATALSGTGIARFSGSHAPVRLWTSTAQLTAPEVSLDRTAGTLTAKSSAGGAQVPVRLTLLQQPKAGAIRAGGGTVLVTARDLRMRNADGTESAVLDVSGDVRIVAPGSTVTADHAVARLKQPSGDRSARTPQPQGIAPLGGGSSLDSILATGNVHLQQPGRSGTGERLLYTESDNRYELTGTPSSPPALQDSLRGSLTGTTLIFHGGDDSVEVAGEAGRRVHTETHAQPARKR